MDRRLAAGDRCGSQCEHGAGPLVLAKKVWHGKLYAVGGLTVGGEVGAVLDTVEEYDPATDSWTNKAPLSRSRVGAGLAAASNGKLYAIGDDTGGSPANEEFTP